MEKGKVPEFVIVEKEEGRLGLRETRSRLRAQWQVTIESALLAGIEVSWQKCWPMFDSS